MDFTQLVGAIGVGAILTKILDIVWLQKTLEKKEQLAWLREKRFDAFTKLSKELLSFGSQGNESKNRFELNSIASEAILLINNEILIDNIIQFFIKLERLYDHITEYGVDDKRTKDLYVNLTNESKNIIHKLRFQLLEMDTKNFKSSSMMKKIESLYNKSMRTK